LETFGPSLRTHGGSSVCSWSVRGGSCQQRPSSVHRAGPNHRSGMVSLMNCRCIWPRSFPSHPSNPKAMVRGSPSCIADLENRCEPRLGAAHDGEEHAYGSLVWRVASTKHRNPGASRRVVSRGLLGNCGPEKGGISRRPRRRNANDCFSIQGSMRPQQILSISKSTEESTTPTCRRSPRSSTL